MQQSLGYEQREHERPPEPFGFGDVPAVFHELGELLVRDAVTIDGERRDGDFPDRSFTVFGKTLFVVRSHEEAAARQLNEALFVVPNGDRRSGRRPRATVGLFSRDNGGASLLAGASGRAAALVMDTGIVHTLLNLSYLQPDVTRCGARHRLRRALDPERRPG
jgi:hypothetical protein